MNRPVPCRVCSSDVSEDDVVLLPRQGARPDRYAACTSCFSLQRVELDERLSDPSAREREISGHPPDTSPTADGMSGVVDFLVRWVPAGGRVHEIGAGRGALLAALTGRGLRASGCEPNEGLSGWGRASFGLDEDQLQTADGETFLSRVEQGADLIVLWHVVEHLTGVAEELLRCADVLAPGGHLAYQVPMVRPGVVFPAHVSFFTERTPERLAALLGMPVVHQEVDPVAHYLTVVHRREDDVIGASLVRSEASPAEIMADVVTSLDRSRERVAAALAASNAGIVAAQRLAVERLEALERASAETADVHRVLRAKEAELAEATALAVERLDALQARGRRFWS